jgi:hypothetical protein
MRVVNSVIELGKLWRSNSGTMLTLRCVYVFRSKHNLSFVKTIALFFSRIHLPDQYSSI